MAEIEINLKKASAERFFKHLKEEHPKYSKNAKIEKSNEKKGCKGTIFTGEF